MRARKVLALCAVVGAFSLVAAACSSDDDSSSSSSSEKSEQTTTTMAEKQTIVDIAAGNEDFSTLVDLVGKAGLAETLSGEGPFTVFAPTNEAFAKVPQSTLDALAANPEALKKVLTYHVVAGKVMSSDLQPSQSPATVEGQTVTILVDPSTGATINGAKITKTDIEGSNGVIHVIDTVLIPADLQL